MKKETITFGLAVLGGLIAVASIILNIVQYRHGLTKDREAQPGPIIDHLLTTAMDAQIFKGILARDPSALAQFPGCLIGDTSSWQAAQSAVSGKTKIELEATQWHFLVIRNISQGAYKDLTLSLASGKKLAEFSDLLPNKTILVFLSPEEAQSGGTLSYQLAGSDRAVNTTFPAILATGLLLVSELGNLKQYQLEGLDPRTQDLIKAKSLVAPGNP
jgi:hypothetical protein